MTIIPRCDVETHDCTSTLQRTNIQVCSGHLLPKCRRHYKCRRHGTECIRQDDRHNIATTIAAVPVHPTEELNAKHQSRLETHFPKKQAENR